MITLAEKLLLGIRAGAGAESKPYVEFVSSTAMTITPKYTNSGVTLQYSLNKTTWTTIETGVATPSANVIYFRGQATGTKSLFTSSAASNAWTFSSATNLECNGKLDRLLQNAIGSDNDVLTIGDYCYASMFQGCTSLTTAPALPATTLAGYCYYYMFYGCTKIKLSTTLTGIYDKVYRIPTAGTGTTATNALLDMFTSTGGTFTGTPNINTTYYTENTPV